MDKNLFEKNFERALIAGQKRRYAEAIKILEDLAARGYADGGSPIGGKSGSSRSADQAHPEIYLYLARSWHAEGKFARSSYYLRSYINARPDDGSGWFFFGRSSLSQGYPERAVWALRKSLALNPDSIDTRALLGSAYLRCKRPSLALAVFEEALTLAPEDQRLNQGYLNALFVEAVRTYKRGEVDLARQMLTFLINREVDGVVPRLYLAHSLRDLGYLEEALGEYTNAGSFAPDDDSLIWFQISVYLEMGNAEEASRLMATLGEGAQEISPGLIGLRIVRSHLEKDSWAQATQAARTWIKQFGHSAQIHALMGEAYRNLGDIEKALNHFTRALEIEPRDQSPRYGILMVYLSAQDWGGLSRELDKALKAGLDRETIDYYQALCRANLDSDPASLLVDLQNEVRKRGAVPELLAALARTYFRLGMADLAIGWYQKVLDLQEDNEAAFLGYLACCEQEGNHRRLEAAYEQYLSRWDDNEVIRKEYISYLEQHERWEIAADQIEILSAQGKVSNTDRQIAYFRRKAGQWRKAAILYRSMLKQKPDDRTLLSSLVYCLDRMGESDAALALMKSANRAFKADADSLLIEGRLCLRSGKEDDALKVFRAVVDTYPMDERGWEEIAALYDRRGVPEMAATFRQKARDNLVRKTKKPVKKR